MQSVIETYIALLGASADQRYCSGRKLPARASRSAVAPCRTRLPHPAPGLRRAIRRWPSLRARSRTWRSSIAAELGALNNMLACRPRSATTRSVRALQAGLEKLRAAGRDRPTRDRAPVSRIREPGRAQAADGGRHPRSAEAGRGIRVVLFRAPLEFRLGCAEKRSGRLRRDPDPGHGDRREDRQSCAKRSRLNVSTVEEIPPFDLALAHELYKICSPGGGRLALGKEPVSSPTARSACCRWRCCRPSRPPAVRGGEPMFAGYRNVAWLARTHAVTMVPSAAALRTLRRLPAPVGSARTA